MLFNMSFEKMRSLLKTRAKTMDRRSLESQALSMVKMSGQKAKEKIVDGLLETTRPSELIPDRYGEYRQIVDDGIRFMLSRISLKRLVQIAVDQGLMNDDVSARERAIRLALKMPTLHKLGQIIARNRNVDESVRKQLVRLENGDEGTDFEEIRRTVMEEIGEENMKSYNIGLEDYILSEASVGVVVPFDYIDPATGRPASGVFKIVRPSVREHLNEELDALRDMARWFTENRDRYHLRNFGFTDTFQEVREALQKELELLGEQENLEKASRFYVGDKSVRIPSVLPFSTRNATAMELVEGCKITDADAGSNARKEYAVRLFKALLCSPVFSRKKRTLFHGDPHAGNIYAVKDKKTQVALLDWSLAGNLPIQIRVGLLRLLVGVITENEDRIVKAVSTLSEENPRKDDPLYGKIRRIARETMAGREYADNRLVGRTFLFIDNMLVNGVKFPKDLLLFRKADFTLEGVLHDLNPVFVMDDHLLMMLAGLLIKEIPKRTLFLLLRPFDRPEHYESLLSNRDLEDIAFHFFFKTLKTGADVMSGIAEFNIDLMGRAVSLPGAICGKCFGLLARPADSMP